MDELTALFDSSVGIIFILLVFLPQIITTLIMSHKGYSGCLWFLLSLFLPWTGVIIAICMPNARRQEERFDEYDLELETEKVRQEYDELKLKQVAERERERQEEQARMEKE
jgi:hypothetical protein